MQLEWWKDPRLDDEGTYDYLVEELPRDKTEWSHYPTQCGDCGKTRKLSIIYYHYFYCYDGWDSMDYTTCWKCHLKSVITSAISKIKKRIISRNQKLNIVAYIVFIKYCKKYNIDKCNRKDLWNTYYHVWANKSTRKIMKRGL